MSAPAIIAPIEVEIPAPDAIAPAPARRLPVVVWAGVFGLLSLIMMSVGVESAMHFFGSAIDGPFQLYNALRRIAVGQRGGVDFQFFHGIALPYLHYIPFRILGGTFTASELSRQLVTIVLYPAVLVLFFRAFTRDWPRTFVLSTIVLAVSIAMKLTSMLIAVNSLLGVRSALPTLLPVAMYLPARRTVRQVATGVTLGGSLLLGTEQGLAALLAFLAISSIAIWRTSERRPRLVDAAVALATMVVTVAIVTTAIGGVAGLKGALYYNLKLVPMDQYWYFGAPPNYFLYSWRALPGELTWFPRIPETILLAMFVVAIEVRRLWRQPDGPEGQRNAALAILAVYGLVSCASILGIYVVVYAQPCMRVLLLIGALELDRVLPPRDLRLSRPPLLGVSRSLVMATGAVLVVTTVAVTSLITAVITTIPHIVADHVVRGEPLVYRGIWPQTLTEGQAILDARRGSGGEPPTLWSTYAGLLEANNGIFHPSFDYVIHALGPENRARYTQQFRDRRPRLVQTVLPTYSQYESWIEQTSWDFYAELLRNYRTVGATPWSIFWERLPTPNEAPTPLWATLVRPGARSLQLPSLPRLTEDANVALLQVELDYRVRNVLHVLPVVGGMPRYLVQVTNAINRYAVPIDPYVTTTRFAVIAVRGVKPTLTFATYSLLPGASFDVSAVRVSSVPINDGNRRWLYDLVQQQTERPERADKASKAASGSADSLRR